MKFMKKNVKFMKKNVKIQKKKKRAIHAANVKFMKIHEKKSEIQEKKVIHEKKVEFMEKKREIHGKQREIHAKKRTIHEILPGLALCKLRKSAAMLLSSPLFYFLSSLIPFYLLLLTIYVSPYLHKTAPHHMNRTELTPEPITVSSHPSIPLFPPSFTV